MPKSRADEPVSAGKYLDRLQPVEAQQVLHELLGTRPDLRTVAGEIAKRLLKEVSYDAVAADVEEAILSIGWDDTPSDNGAMGYVDPVDSAWGALEGAVEPFVEDLKRHIELELETEALELCKGILLGLYRARNERDHDLLAHAEDFPAEAATQTLHAWYGTRPSGNPKARWRRPEFPSSFVTRQIPDWKEIVDWTRRPPRRARTS
jgi:hypothetical protein